MPHAVLNCLYSPDTTLEIAVDILAQRAIELVANGASLLILTDRGATPEALPIPMAMAAGAVHHRAHQGRRPRRSRPRCRCGRLPRDSSRRGSAWTGRRAPSARGSHLKPRAALNPEHGEENLLHALELGLAKVMSKMGISVVDSYRGAHLFDAIGISQHVVDKCFAGVPTPIGGIGFTEIEDYVRQLWSAEPVIEKSAEQGLAEFSAAPIRELPDYGFVRFRKADEAESHSWQPTTVRALQTVVGSTKQGAALALTPFASFRRSGCRS